jgi:hypothetical protein
MIAGTLDDSNIRSAIEGLAPEDTRIKPFLFGYLFKTSSL